MPHEASVQPEASTVSTGLGLRYVKNWVYAYSGLFVGDTDPNTVLDFTSGSGIIVGTIQLNAPVDDDNPTVGTETTCNIQFNGVSISILKATTGASDNAPGSIDQPVIIPPFTRVVCIVDSGTVETDRYGSVTLTGRVYGAE